MARIERTAFAREFTPDVSGNTDAINVDRLCVVAAVLGVEVGELFPPSDPTRTEAAGRVGRCADVQHVLAV